MSHLCPQGHDTVYQAFSGGRSWYCETCDEIGDYDYESMPPEQRPRGWLLTQPGGADELRKQMAEKLGRRQYCTHPAEREWKPGDSRVLPEADTCDHPECRTDADDIDGPESASREGGDPMSADDRMEVGSPEWHSVHHAGEGQHHECDYDVCVEWSMRQVPRPQPAEVRGCRRITDRTCIQMLAEGYHHANDMCPACTRTFMTRLDPDGSLSWHEEYRARASEGVAR